MMEKRQRQCCQSSCHSVLAAFLMLAILSSCQGFVPNSGGCRQHVWTERTVRPSMALRVWWFGGVDEEQENTDSCELVPVRIERTSPNSRRITGEIVVPAPMLDVWSILTDYNRLAKHVPNLVESRIVSTTSMTSTGRAGDGQYRCRLYQKGSQKVIGFEFGAEVTMEMLEQVMLSSERQINFRCVDSFFFSEFDGRWLVQEQKVGDEIQTLVSYTVDVRPKGPVPVSALEWRIREDVPTNLRAVKRAAVTIDQDKVLGPKKRALLVSTTGSANGASYAQSGMRVKVEWSEDETMAAYLRKKTT